MPTTRLYSYCYLGMVKVDAKDFPTYETVCWCHVGRRAIVLLSKSFIAFTIVPAKYLIVKYLILEDVVDIVYLCVCMAFEYCFVNIYI